MTLRILRTSAVFAFSAALLAVSASAQSRPAASESPYGGVTVEEIIARVNDRIITRSDYERAQKEMDAEARQRGASMQEISAGHKDLLRSLIDRQLWLAKGKELGITGETELINRLNEIRKQNHMETLEDLEKAAREQGVSYEDFKANIRDQIVMQQVMREEVGRRLNFTQGELQRYYAEHKQEYVRQESVKLGEILLAASGDDAAKLAAAKAKAEEVEDKLKAGGDFAQLARAFSDGPTASQGGDLGEFQRGNLAKLLEDATFSLKSGQYTAPIRTKQGFVILKVVEHVQGGVPELKEVQSQVEETYYMAKMEPAIRDYLTKMREEAYIDIKPGYTDTGASPRQTKPIYSAYVPPSPKKKAKVERTRFRETPKTFRQKKAPVAADSAATAAADADKKAAVQKPGKKEKIRFGKAPTQTLPDTPSLKTEDAGATEKAAADTPANPLEPAAPTKKTRFSDRAKTSQEPKAKKSAEVKKQQNALAPPAADAAETADRQTQSAPLGLGGDTAAKKAKKKQTTKGEKTRIADRNKEEKEQPTAAPQSAPASK
jgi:peptidyl-prolyl cis-trans isomerase SurA